MPPYTDTSDKTKSHDDFQYTHKPPHQSPAKMPGASGSEDTRVGAGIGPGGMAVTVEHHQQAMAAMAGIGQAATNAATAAAQAAASAAAGNSAQGGATYPAMGALGGREMPVVTKRGLLKKRPLNKYGYATMKGLEDLDQVERSKLPHTWHNYIRPSACFTQALYNNWHSSIPEIHNPALDGGGVTGETLLGDLWKKPPTDHTAITGMQLLLHANVPNNHVFTQPQSAYPTEENLHKPYIEEDLNQITGIPTMRCLNAFSLPIVKQITGMPTAQIVDPSQPQCSYSESKNQCAGWIKAPDGTQGNDMLGTSVDQQKRMNAVLFSGMTGMRPENMVSPPTVNMHTVKIELDICMNTFAPPQTAYKDNAAVEYCGVGGLDFRVLVIQNTDSYVDNYHIPPSLTDNLLSHPMGSYNSRSGGAQQSMLPYETMEGAAVNTVTGWPLGSDASVIGVDGAFIQGTTADARLNRQWIGIPNQDSKSWSSKQTILPQQTTPVNYWAYGPKDVCRPGLRELMHGSINRQAFRVLHDEKFTLAANVPGSPAITGDGKFSTMRGINLEFPVGGMVETVGMNAGGATNVPNSVGTTSWLTTGQKAQGQVPRPYGVEARIQYQNAPRIIILATPVAQRTTVVKVTQGSGEDPRFRPTQVKNLDELWYVNTRGYTTYSDVPHPGAEFAFQDATQSSSAVPPHGDPPWKQQ